MQNIRPYHRPIEPESAFFFLFYLFIHERHTQRETETQAEGEAEGEAGSMQGA